jgi:hypothetical protein
VTEDMENSEYRQQEEKDAMFGCGKKFCGVIK